VVLEYKKSGKEWYCHKLLTILGYSSEPKDVIQLNFLYLINKVDLGRIQVAAKGNINNSTEGTI